MKYIYIERKEREMLKDLGYMHTFPHNLAQINIKSKLRCPVHKHQTRTFFSIKGLEEKV